jgi:hypothetical protein
MKAIKKITKSKAWELIEFDLMDFNDESDYKFTLEEFLPMLHYNNINLNGWEVFYNDELEHYDLKQN